jgi:hypothetical protein
MDDRYKMSDTAVWQAGYNRAMSSGAAIIGWGWAELRDEDGNLKFEVPFVNLVTRTGNQYYGERAAGITSPPNQVTGMRLGTGTTAVAPTGAGSSIVTYVSSITASKAIDSTWPQSSLVTNTRRIQWKTSWAAGEATQSGLAEVVITNENPLTDVIGTEANTIARALLSPVVNKGASDTLAVTWNHDLLGS